VEPLLEKPSMPIGAEMHITGTLERGSHGLAVRSGTGITLIGYPRGAKKLVGRHVEVEGRRTAFDEITCDRIWQRGTPRPAARSLPTFEHMIVGAFIVYGFAASLVSLVS
jgi:hypothetical protein